MRPLGRRGSPGAGFQGLGRPLQQRRPHRRSAANTPLSPLPLQVPQERAEAEQMLRVFGTSTEYVSHCKVSA